jgi:type II secretory pathway predicted ATPase ExeA
MNNRMKQKDQLDHTRRTQSALATNVIETPVFKAATDALDQLMAMNRHKINEGLLITGLTGCGKTTVAKEFTKANPPVDGQKNQRRPVVYFKLPANPSPKSLAVAALSAFGQAYTRGTTAELEKRLVTLLQAAETHVVIVDEAHTLVERGNEKDQRMVADTIKNVMEDSGVSFTLMGLPVLKELLVSNEQLRRRFSRQVTLERLPLLSRNDLNVFTKLLRSILKAAECPYSPNLLKPGSVERIHYATNGRPSYVAKLFVYAIAEARKAGSRTIGKAHVERAFLSSIYPGATAEWNPFSARFKFQPLEELGQPFQAVLP